MKSQIEQNVVLVRDKNDLKNEVEERLKIGREFLSQEIEIKNQKTEWWNSFVDWDIYNEELIRQAFDKPNNSYFEDYTRSNDVSDYIGIYGGGEFQQPTLDESIESIREEMKYQVQRLKWFYDKIPLFKESQDLRKSDDFKAKFNNLLNLLNRFHKIAQELRNRREDRETLIIKDEYDVQDLLNALLHIYFKDIRKEDPVPINSGGSSRLDFVLKDEKIIIEVKITNENLKQKKLGEQILIDVGRYKEYPDCETFVVFIYDKGDYIRNKRGLKTDLENHSTDGFKITVIICPD